MNHAFACVTYITLPLAPLLVFLESVRGFGYSMCRLSQAMMLNSYLYEYIQHEQARMESFFRVQYSRITFI